MLPDLETLLQAVALHCGLIIQAMAVFMLVVGAFQAFITGVLAMLISPTASADLKLVWLRFLRWLIAGLTFLLAADAIHTAVAPTWDEIKQMAAIAVIRTILAMYFEHEVSKLRARETIHS